MVRDNDEDRWEKKGGEPKPHPDAMNNFKLMLKMQYHGNYEKMVREKNMRVKWEKEDPIKNVIYEPICISFHWKVGADKVTGAGGIPHGFVISFHQKHSDFIMEISRIFGVSEKEIFQMR